MLHNSISWINDDLSVLWVLNDEDMTALPKGYEPPASSGEPSGDVTGTYSFVAEAEVTHGPHDIIYALTLNENGTYALKSQIDGLESPHDLAFVQGIIPINKGFQRFCSAGSPLFYARFQFFSDLAREDLNQSEPSI